MDLPVQVAKEVAKKAVIPLTAAIAALGGFVLGGLARQPEINDLKNQVKQLKKQHEHLIQVVNSQNREIQELLVRYQALKVYQIFQRADMKAQLEESLIFQYATADYLELMLSCINDGANPSEVEGAFYYAFSKMLSGKNLSEDEMRAVKEYVLPRHKDEIDSLTPCNTNAALQQLMEYEEPKEQGFEFPKIEMPEIEIPKFEFPEIELPKVEFPEIKIPLFSNKEEKSE